MNLEIGMVKLNRATSFYIISFINLVHLNLHISEQNK